MKKLFLLSIIFVLSLSLVACGANEEATAEVQQESVTLKVGATAVPHAEILEVVKLILAEDGINLEIVVYQDYVQPNIHLSEGEIDANYFQHIPYFESFTSDRGITNLTNALKVHIEPMGIYSLSLGELSELDDGATVSIPNDPSNMGRALALLEKAGLITLQDGVGVKGTVQDIVENPKNLEIVPLEAPMLPRSLEDVDISVINTNYALQADLNPTTDALVIEDADSPYVNVLTIRTEDENDEAIQKLIKALTSEEVKKFIEDKYQGAVVPTF